MVILSGVVYLLGYVEGFYLQFSKFYVNAPSKSSDPPMVLPCSSAPSYHGILKDEKRD